MATFGYLSPSLSAQKVPLSVDADPFFPPAISGRGGGGGGPEQKNDFLETPFDS